MGIALRGRAPSEDAAKQQPPPLVPADPDPSITPNQIAGGAIGKEVLHLFPGAMLVAGLMLMTRCLSASQARASMDWEVFICIAFAFAVSSGESSAAQAGWKGCIKDMAGP